MSLASSSMPETPVIALALPVTAKLAVAPIAVAATLVPESLWILKTLSRAGAIRTVPAVLAAKKLIALPSELKIPCTTPRTKIPSLAAERVTLPSASSVTASFLPIILPLENRQSTNVEQ